MKAELIRYARRYAYQDVEGFNSSCVEFDPEKLEPKNFLAFVRAVIELAEAAGISYEVAQGAFISWLIEAKLSENL